MRITNNMMMGRYQRNLNMNLNRMSDSSGQVATGRRFMRGSEDPVRALKALQVRRRGDALEQFHFNIEAADFWLKDTETAVMAIKSSADRAYDLFLQGRNDPLAAEDRQIIATSLRSIQEQILKDLNTQLAGKHLLGGANTKHTPFVMCDATGHLWFNVHPDLIEEGRDPDTGLLDLTGVDHGMGGWNVFMMGQDGYDYYSEATVFWDLTGETQWRWDDDSNQSGNFTNTTALFDVRTTGLDIIGTGPDNLFNLVGRMALAFEMEDMRTIDGPVDSSEILEREVPGFGGESFSFMEDFLISRFPDRNQPNPDFDPSLPEMPGNRRYSATTMGRYASEDYLQAFDGVFGLAKRLQDAQLRATLELTKVGERSNYVNFLRTRNESSMFQMQEMQNKLEALPPDEAILYFKMHDYVYKATLQMSTYIFQPSLISFLGR